MDLPSDIHHKVFRYISKGPFKNRHGVAFEVEDHKTLYAGKQIEFIEGIARVDIEFSAETKLFTGTLNLTTIRDIYGIDQSILETLYIRGEAALVCEVYLAYIHIMVFKLVARKTLALNGTGHSHAVDVELLTVTDFITYSIDYCKVLEQTRLRQHII